MFKHAIALSAAALSLSAGLALAQTASPPAAVDDRNINVRQSADYDRLISSNEAFRQKRIRDECDPITAADLKQACIDSFRAVAPPPARPAR